jgi:hypothetical protein
MVVGSLTAVALSQRPTAHNAVVAYVDGSPITRDEFEDYSGVFTNPSGHLQIGQDQVLLSLINQRIISRDAARLGVSVDVGAVDAAMNEMARIGANRRSLDSSGGVEGLRSRVEAFFELKQVKAAVVGTIAVSDDQVRIAYASEPSMHDIPLAEVANVLRERLIAAEADRRWSEWLARRRSCAKIDVVDASLGVRTSTPSAGCPVEP